MRSQCPLCQSPHEPAATQGRVRRWALCPNCAGRFAFAGGHAVPAGSLERFGEPVLVLDGAARLLACNRAAETAFGSPLEALQGLAPGELLECDHAQAAGCGNDAHCPTCGLRQAILYTQRHDRDCERLPVMVPVSAGGQLQLRCLTVSTRRLNGWVRLQLEDDGFLPQPSMSIL